MALRFGSIFAAIFCSICVLFLASSLSPSSATRPTSLAKPFVTPQAQAAYHRQCDVKTVFDSNYLGYVPLRWGNRSFGYNHIIARKHPYYRQVISYVLNYGYEVEHYGTREVYQAVYPSPRNRSWRVVYDRTFNSASCPGKILGIITAYPGTRD